MEAQGNCKLTPALVRLLQTSLDLGTTSTKPLSDALFLSQATVRTEFQQVLRILDVRTRGAAVITAIQRGIVSLNGRGTDDPGSNL